jgi:anti-sigma factor RsiW
MTPTTPSSRPENLCDALRRAADDLASRHPPMPMPAAVQAAFDSRRKGKPSRSGWRAAWTGGAMAALTLVVAVAILAGAPRDRTDSGRMAAQAGPSTAFLPLAGSDRWPQLMQDAREQGKAWVVPTELPRESLAAMGLPFDPGRAGESVRAELLVHASGVLAVRFVR